MRFHKEEKHLLDSNTYLDQLPVDSTTQEEGAKKFCIVWRRVFFKLKVQRALKKFKEEILMFGTTNNTTDLNNRYKPNIDRIIHKKLRKEETFRMTHFPTLQEPLPWYLIHPESSILKVWSIVVALCLAYTASIMPYRLAFHELVFWDEWTIFELGIDCVFFVDILINLFTSYYLSTLVVQKKWSTIAKNYLFSWLLLDLSACVPFSLIEYYLGDSASSGSRYNSLLRLIRLPRMYKLLKLVRVFKMLKQYNRCRVFDVVYDFIVSHARLVKMFKFFLSISVCVHITGCFWYYTARVEDFGPNTWVVRHEYYNMPESTQYLASVYWAFTTITTVGYGDIYPETELEILLSIMWMIVGVGFYSYTIGSLTTVLTEQDTRDKVLNAKLEAIKDFQNETGISLDCARRIRKVIRYNSSKGDVVWKDKIALFKEIPKYLRYEIASTMYKGLSQHSSFIKGKDQSFVIELMPLLRPLRHEDSEYVYCEKEYADSVYMISAGRVNLVYARDVTYKSYLKGGYFGDSEVLNKIENRQDTVQACGAVDLLCLDKKHLLRLLEDFPKVKKELKSIASEKLSRHKEQKDELKRLLRIPVDNQPADDCSSPEEDTEAIRRIQRNVVLATEKISELGQKVSTIEQSLLTIQQALAADH